MEWVEKRVRSDLRQKGTGKRVGLEDGSESSYVIWVGSTDKKTWDRAGGSRVKDAKVCTGSDVNG